MEGRYLFLILCYCWTTTSSQLLSNNVFRKPRQLDFGECCPCSTSNNIGNDQQSYPGEEVSIERCPCKSTVPVADVASAASILVPTLQALRPLITSDIEKKPKPLLNPEVDLASSVLETLQEVTDEEYQDALSRDVARSAIKPLETDLLQPTDETGNIVNIILNPKQSGNDLEHIPEASHIQETRCIHSPLGSSNNYKTNHFKSSLPQISKQKINSMKNWNLPNRNIYDMDNGASNIKTNIHTPSKFYSLKNNLGNEKQHAELFPTKSFQEITDNIRSSLNTTKKIFKNKQDLNLGSFMDYLKKSTQEKPIISLFSSKKALNNKDILPTSSTEIGSQKKFLNQNNSFFNFRPKNILKPLAINNERHSNKLKNLLKLKDVELISKQHNIKPFGKHITSKNNRNSLDTILENASVNDDQKKCHENLETGVTDAIESPSETEIVTLSKVSASKESNQSRNEYVSNLVTENYNVLNCTDLIDAFTELNSIARIEKNDTKTTDKYLKTIEDKDEKIPETIVDPCVQDMTVFETTTVENKVNHKLNIVNDFQNSFDSGLALTENNPIEDLSNIKNKYMKDKKTHDVKKLVNLKKYAESNNENFETSLKERQYLHDNENKEKNIRLSTLQKMSDNLLNLSYKNQLAPNISNQSNESDNNDNDNIGSETNFKNIVVHSDNICDTLCKSNDLKNTVTKNNNIFLSETSTITPTTLNRNDSSSFSLNNMFGSDEEHIKEMCVQASEPIISRASVIKPHLKSTEQKTPFRVKNLNKLDLKAHTARISIPDYLNRNVLNEKKIINSMLGDNIRPDILSTKRKGAEPTIKSTNYNNIFRNLPSADDYVFEDFNKNKNDFWIAFNKAHKDANDKLQALHKNLHNKLQSINFNELQLDRNRENHANNFKNKLSEVNNRIYKKLNLNSFNAALDDLPKNKKQRDQEIHLKSIHNNKLFTDLNGLSKTQLSGENKIRGKTSKTKPSSIENVNVFVFTTTAHPKLRFSSKNIRSRDYTTMLPFKLPHSHLIKSAVDVNSPNPIQFLKENIPSKIGEPKRHHNAESKNTIKNDFLKRANDLILTSSLSSFEDIHLKKPLQPRQQDTFFLHNLINGVQNKQSKLDKFKHNINNSLQEMGENLQSPTQNIEQFTISDKTLKENVTYKCKMVCTEDN